MVLLFASGLTAADSDRKPDPPPDQPGNPADQARRRPRIRLGGIMVGAGYSRSSAWCCGYGGYGSYGPWWPAYFGWDGILYHPYYLSGFGWGANMGEVKLRSAQKDAEVFLDGAYAGTASERKSMWLDPGAYNLEVRSPGAVPYTRRIYVLSGKSLKVRAEAR